MKKRRIADAASIAEGQAIKFEFVRGERTLEGFVARFKGKLLAYENVCQHLPISLDYGDNRFFTRDGAHFLCQTHGAIYEPTTGMCIRGPCEGDKLKPLRVEVMDGSVWLLE